MTEREAIYLGALLHDIGKFRWRAQKIEAGKDHETLGEEYIREHLGKCIAVRDNLETVVDAANRKRGKIWAADCMSAMERKPEEKGEARRPLISVFTQVAIGKAPKPKGVWEILPAPLRTKEHNGEPGADGFPLERPGIEYDTWVTDPDDMINRHKASWDSFVAETRLLAGIEDSRAFLQSFYSLMEKYTSTVCSAGWRTRPDITLFDHSRLAAALAICFEEGKGEKECLMIKGDISGIQSFIYADIVQGLGRRPAKTLRGKSFFINLLSAVITRYLIRELGLFEANLFFRGGGHWVIVAPNNDGIAKRLDVCEAAINTMLFEMTGGRLHAVHGRLPVSAKELMRHYGEVFQRLTADTNNRKLKKSFNILDRIMLEPIGRETLSAGMENVYIELGGRLPKSDHLVITGSGTDRAQKAAHVDFRGIGLRVYLCKAEELESVIAGAVESGCVTEAVNIADYSFPDPVFLSRHYQGPVSFTFDILKVHVPVVDASEETLEFGEIASLGVEGVPLLGFARMDVDDLGTIFFRGLKDEEQGTAGETGETGGMETLSRIATISREFNRFFSGIVNHIAGNHHVYIVYSGGDDLFAVASWKNALLFVRDVREQFSRFVCGNGNITLSCGLTFTHESASIQGAAEEAGEEEHKAKTEDPNKDRVALLSRVLTWKELSAMLNMGENLKRLLEQKEYRSFIHAILEMTRKCFDERGKVIPGKIARLEHRLAYKFARRKAGEREIRAAETAAASILECPSPDTRDDLHVILAKYMLESDAREKENRWKNFVIPATYVLWETRERKK